MSKRGVLDELRTLGDLAAAVLRALLERGFEGVFYNYSRLLDHITMSWKPGEAGPMDKEASQAGDRNPSACSRRT
jgi:hypothetical protein